MSDYFCPSCGADMEALHTCYGCGLALNFKIEKELSLWKSEALAAREMRDEINSYSVGMSLLSEDDFYERIIKYDAARKATDEAGLK